MALFIRDAEVDALVEKVVAATGAKTKKEAVRSALENELQRQRRKIPVRERIARAQALADAIGPSDPNFDFKKFREELWGDED